MSETAVVLAGGLGTRLRSVVSDVPKPMAPVNGRPFLTYLLDHWLEQGIRRFVICVGYKAEVIRKYFGRKYRSAEIIYSVEGSPLGTGGALIQSLHLLERDSSFLLINGDTYFDVSLKDLSSFHTHTDSELTFCVLNVANNQRYGTIDIESDGRVRSLNCVSQQENSSWINGGVYMMEADLIDKSVRPTGPVSLENDLFPQFMTQKKRLYGFATKNNFIDIGIPGDYILSKNLLPALSYSRVR